MKGFLAILLFIPLIAPAEDSFPPYTDRPLNFSLHISHHTFDLDYTGSKVDTSMDRVSVKWRERFSDRLQLGLIGGYASLTQINNPITQGRELNGYHVGFSLDLDLLRTERTDFFFNSQWLYQEVDHDDGAQRVEITAREPSARLGAGLKLDANLRFYGGLRYGAINGEQRSSGIINETRKIKEARETGGFAGLELQLEKDGYVGIVVESGVDRNIALYFGKRY